MSQEATPRQSTGGDEAGRTLSGRSGRGGGPGGAPRAVCPHSTTVSRWQWGAGAPVPAGTHVAHIPQRYRGGGRGSRCDMPQEGAQRGVCRPPTGGQGCREGRCGCWEPPHIPAASCAPPPAGCREVTAVYDPPHICAESRAHSLSRPRPPHSPEGPPCADSWGGCGGKVRPVDPPQTATQVGESGVLATGLGIERPQGPGPASQGHRGSRPISRDSSSVVTAAPCRRGQRLRVFSILLCP